MEGQVFGNALALIIENSVISKFFFSLMDGNAFVSGAEITQLILGLTLIFHIHQNTGVF